MPWRSFGILVAACLLLPVVQAYEQSEAPQLDDRVELAWASEGVQAGQQWQAHLRFKEGSNITAVGYQACIVPGACIIAPRNATRVDERTWRMDTADFVNPVRREPYPWAAGKVGVKWFIASNGTDFLNGRALPMGLDPNDPACADAVACLESHYLTLTVASVPSQDAAAIGWFGLLVAFVVVGWRRRA